jgi:hypothetical protein
MGQGRKEGARNYKVKFGLNSFYQHSLEEDAVWTKSASEHIFHDDLHIPLTPKMLKRALNTKLPRVRVFHVTNTKYFDDVVKLQGKKKSISALTRAHQDIVTGGINVSGGMVFELEADVMVSAPNDIMSRPDKTGRRWLQWEYLNPAPYEDQTKMEIEKYGLSLKRDLIMKYVPGMGKIPLTKVHHYWRKLDPRNETSPLFQNLIKNQGRKKSAAVKRTGVRHGVTRNTSKEINAILRDMVKDYIDAMEKMIAKYSKEFAIMMFAHSQNAMKEVDGWDELVVNNYRIKQVMLHDYTVKRGFSRKDEDIQEEEWGKLLEKLDSLGIDYEVFEYASNISREITMRSSVDLLK